MVQVGRSGGGQAVEEEEEDEDFKRASVHLIRIRDIDHIVV